ncbi:MAG: cellulase family glycosylhydrolase [Candidatus Lokiarchaeota archaeon]|nr:cellulase family glycosylhydrolase [Candidatus Lokiarchaeota archaeon]
MKYTKQIYKVKSLRRILLIVFFILMLIIPLYIGGILTNSVNHNKNNFSIDLQENGENLAPHASFRVSPNGVKTGGIVSCYALTSYDLDGKITTYNWDFGDGTTGSGSEVYHQYSLTGKYIITLTVIDDGGLTDIYSQSVSVDVAGSPEQVDTAKFNWEDGTTEGFDFNTWNVPSGTSGSVENDINIAYSGTHSLKCNVETANVSTVDFRIDSTIPLIEPGSTVLFRYWIPSGTPISIVQPYIMPHTSDWSESRWFSDWTPIDGVTTNSWNEGLIILSADIDPTWGVQIGIQIEIDGASSFSFNIDSIDWFNPSIPKASFEYSVMRPNPGELINFDALNSLDQYLVSSDPDGIITSFEWDFGDGTIDSGSVQTHSYSSAGKYPVTLTITDNEGNIHGITRVIWCGIEERPFAPTLQIQDAQIVDADGRPVSFKGVAIVDDLTYTEADFDYLKYEWKMDAIRLPLIIERWYYATATERENYLATYDKYLQWTFDRGMYVSFDPWHESGQGDGELILFNDIKDAFHIAAQRYGQWTHMIWEIVNEPHKADWATWAPMAEELIDIVRSYNPASTACVVPGVHWAQDFDVRNRPINRPNVGYSVHPYPHVYMVGDTWTYESWDQGFGYIVNEGYGPIINTEWSYPLFEEGNREYGELILSYMEERNIGFLGWIYGSPESWGSMSRDLNVRGDCQQLWWEYLNGIWSPESSPPDYEIGDVNHDQQITIVDALLISQYEVGFNPSPFYPEQADVNMDGIINIIDALLIAQFTVGLIPSLPPPT